MKAPLSMLWLLLAVQVLFPACGDNDSSNRPDAGVDDGEFTPADGDADGQVADGPTDAGEDSADEEPVVLSVQAVLPSRGPVAGGTWANIVGSGFVRGIADSPFDVRDVTAVRFGDNSAIDIEVIRDDMISVRTPPGLAGEVPVSVENPNGTARLQGAFTYFETVTAVELTPRDFLSTGGTSFSLTGTGFTADTWVLFGNRLATGVVVTDSGHLNALAPPGPTGPVDVEVVNRHGRALLFRAATYHAPIELVACQPVSGPIAGGTRVELSGSGLASDLQVLFSESPASDPALVDESTLSVTTPAGTAGAVDVQAIGSADASRLAGGFVYLDEPDGNLRILAISPASGSTAGGFEVTVVGDGFPVDISGVWFDDRPVESVTRLDERHLNVRIPKHEAGSVSVRVATSRAEARLDDGFTYHADLALESLEPRSGPLTGGTPFVLEGYGFHDDLQVLFAGIPATALRVISANELTGLTPANSPGPVDLELADALVRVRFGNAFTYESPLQLKRVDPDTGAQTGGTYVRLYGSGFDADCTVWFGPRMAQVVQVDSPTVMRVRTPRGDPGEVPVSIRRGDLRFDLPAGYSYFDPTNDRGGATGGPLDGALNVTALDGGWTRYGNPVPDALVLIDEPALSGTTDDRGQVTFSGPALVRDVTVTVGKPGYQAITIASLNAANLTVYLNPNEQEPVDIQPGQIVAGSIQGHIFGFKNVPGLPSGEGITHEARLNFTSYSIYSVPPFAGEPQGSPVENDGDSYSFTLRFGNYSLYAVFGAYDANQNLFTPALLGTRRNIVIMSEEPLEDQDIVLSSPLDQSVWIHHLNPPLGSDETPAEFGAYASLDLGTNGVIYLNQVRGPGLEVKLDKLPAAAGNAFLFVGLASVDSSFPLSYTFRRQEGDLSAGVTLGPYLNFTEFIEPEENGPLLGGRIVWRSPQDPPPALTKLSIETAELIPKVIWQVFLPGDATEVRLPPELLELLPGGDPLILKLWTADSPRFDFDRFNYAQMYTSRWTGYTYNLTVFTAP